MRNRTVLLLAVLITLGMVQGESSQTRPRGLAAQKLFADKAWPSFFQSFRAAVSKRDRVALKEMMVRDFFFSGGGGDDNHNDDSRDEAFKFLDDPNVKSWQAFDKALAKGAVPS